MSNHQYAKQSEELKRSFKRVESTLIFDQFKEESKRKIGIHQITEALKYLKVALNILGEDIKL